MNSKNIVYYMIVDKDEIKIDNCDSLDTVKAQKILKDMLDYLNLKFSKIYINSYGKPYFKDSNIYFNYSHSKHFIACAVSLEEVGIDIEDKTRKIIDSVSKKYLDNVEGDKKLESWVRKESYSKLKGLGLQIGFKNIKLDELTEKNLLISTNKYICSIYSASNDIIFKRLDKEECIYGNN